MLNTNSAETDVLKTEMTKILLKNAFCGCKDTVNQNYHCIKNRQIKIKTRWMKGIFRRNTYYSQKNCRLCRQFFSINCQLSIV